MNKHHFDKTEGEPVIIGQFEEAMRSIMSSGSPKGKVPSPTKEELEARHKLVRNRK